MKMEKRISRKAELRRLAAKRGWNDGHQGIEPSVPKKTVALAFSAGTKKNSVPQDEEQAYWEGYHAGRVAPRGAVNPYC